MAERDARERDILIATNEYTYVQDLTKGDIVLYVGPTKISLSNTERMVEFKGGRFQPMRADDASSGVSPFVFATSSQYMILENPPKDATNRAVKGSNSSCELLVGRKVVIPGPAMFPLWPGQRAEVIDGHKLREDQYLVVRVTDKVEGDGSPIGAERIVKGSELSFYIPKTGLEVVPEKAGSYVRTAVTLLDGQFCILLSPNGRRKYVRGPAIVFPEPMDEFVQVSGTKIFRAHPLRKNMGLQVRVVREHTAAENDQLPAGHYAAGQELFLHNREGYFFPTENLEAVGEVESIPISDKEGLYVRDVESGRIWTEIGPKSFLPDPTRVEIVARELSEETAHRYGLLAPTAPGRAVSIYIPPSFAVLVTAKNRREVVKGPQTRILSFDEDLEVMTLSTGKPKTDATLLATCFLQVEGNKVSDIIRVKTSDHVELEVLLSYRVSFQAAVEKGDERWFNVKNYVALLCDHLGSIVRGSVRATSIDSFHANSTEVIRAAILGEKPGEGRRAGRRFEENGMNVYDVEVLDVKILDPEVKKLLSDAQRAAIVSELHGKHQGFRLRDEEVKEKVNQAILGTQKVTLDKDREVEESRRALLESKGRTTVEVDGAEQIGRAKNAADALAISSAAEGQVAERRADLDARVLAAKVGAFEKQMAALQPELITTLRALGNQQAAAEISKNLAPLAILGGESVAEVLERLIRALPVGIGGPAELPAPKKPTK